MAALQATQGELSNEHHTPQDQHILTIVHADQNVSVRGMQRSGKSSDNGVGIVRPYTALILRGRYFSPEDIRIVEECTNQHYDRGRTFISEAVCRRLDWKQPNGWLKDRACRDVLVRLDRLGVISLPPPRVAHGKVDKAHRPQQQKTRPVHIACDPPLTNFPERINLEFAKGNAAEKTWNELVEQYHYLGHEIVVGRCIKYIIQADDKVVGAIAFSSPAWKLAPRDQLLQIAGICKDSIPEVVINNTRFLILPSVAVPNLASHVLSQAVRRVVFDWTWYYSITPQVVETFIEPAKYSGICYKAANWLEIGMTKGYAKRGSKHDNCQDPKRILLYGVNKRMRRRLQRAMEQKTFETE